MRDGRSFRGTKLRAAGPAFAVAAIVAGGVVWSGCGSNSTSESTAKAKQEVEAGTKKAEEALKEGTKQAEEGIEEAKEQAEKYLP